MLPGYFSRLPSAGRLAEAGLLRAASVAFDWKAQRLQPFHASAPAAGDAGAGAALDAALSAFSPAEPLGAAGLSPIVLGTSVWEVMHAATGLPWWASIPLTTLALRTALLPLTVKARAATVNFALMRQATLASGALWERMQQEQQAAAGGGAGGKAGGGKAAAGAAGKAVTRTQLTKQYLKYMHKQHGTPSIWWYTANAAVQVNVFLSMSAALRQMSAMMWPGFDSEGLAWFVDMTKPAVEWGTWVCPYGLAGVFLPLAVFGAYVRTLEYTSVANRPRARAALEALTFPMFLAACVVPHATALYWLTNGVFGLGLQAALSRPKVAAALGLPMVAVHARGDKQAAVKSEIERRQTEGTVEGSEDPDFVRYLAADTLSRGQYAAAAACLKRLTALQPSDVGAWHQLAGAASRLGQWGAAADAHEKAGDLLLAAARRPGGNGSGGGSGGSGGGGGGGGGGGAAEAGAEYVSAAVAQLNAALVRPGDGGGGDDEPPPPSAAKLAHVGRALELLHKAEAKAGVSDARTWYYTCMGRLATGQLPAALEAAQRSWEHAQRRGGGSSGGDGSGDGGGGGSGGSSGEGGSGSGTLAADASRLALPLGALCERLAAAAGGGASGGAAAAAAAQLMRAAELAAAVGAASGSGETRGGLRDALESAADTVDGRRGAGSEEAWRLRELAEGLL